MTCHWKFHSIWLPCLKISTIYLVILALSCLKMSTKSIWHNADHLVQVYNAIAVIKSKSTFGGLLLIHHKLHCCDTYNAANRLTPLTPTGFSSSNDNTIKIKYKNLWDLLNLIFDLTRYWKLYSVDCHVLKWAPYIWLQLYMSSTYTNEMALSCLTLSIKYLTG